MSVKLKPESSIQPLVCQKYLLTFNIQNIKIVGLIPQTDEWTTETPVLFLESNLPLKIS